MVRFIFALFDAFFFSARPCQSFLRTYATMETIKSPVEC